MATIDWLILAAYLVLIVFMGGWFARRQNSTEAFFLGGRSVPWWAVGFLLFRLIHQHRDLSGLSGPGVRG